MSSDNASVGGNGLNGGSSEGDNGGSGSGSTHLSESGSVAGKRGKIVPKNALGKRSDVGWQHGISVNGNTRKIKCKYCLREITGRVYRLKHHLAGTQKDVGACTAVSDEIRKQMWEIVAGLQKNLIMKTRTRSNEEALGEKNDGQSVDSFVGEKRKGKEVETLASLFKKRGISTQTTINTIFKKNLREEACEEIASFFYNSAIVFNVARSEEYEKMFEKVTRHGIGFKPPSYNELRLKYLKKKVDSTMEMLEEHRAYWKKTGCTIMTDGWTDKRRRTILKFLVNSPKGTIFLKSIDASHICKTANKIFKMIDDVVEEVGEENVVQVVTDNAANYKAAGQMLMEKRKKLYWTPCAAHCIDLMLEDFEKKLELHKETIAKGRKITTYIYSRTSLISLLQYHTKGKDLVRPGMTRFATSYLTLGSLNEKKSALLRMFISDEWKSSKCSKTRDGKFIEAVVLDRLFWRDIVHCLRGAYPLIHGLRLVDSDEKPAMGYIYEEMDRAKEKIQKAFQGVEKSYMPLWEIIDARWDSQLHIPLHAAGYYLNPQLHYSPTFKSDYEVKRGLYDCLERIVGDPAEITKIDAQLEDFKSRAKFFGREVAKAALNTKTPAQWWDSYGDEHPELQKFAIRVLSLTCSSSGCERNWSAFEMVDGNFIEAVLSGKRRIGYISILFYASWCPFSHRVLPNFEILSSMFPQVEHLALEQSSASPSLYSKYGIHSLPAILLVNQTSRVRYCGPNNLFSLVEFYERNTGFEASSEIVVGQQSSLMSGENSTMKSLMSSSVREISSRGPYLVFSVLFLCLRILLFVFPKILLRLQALWVSYIPHLNMQIFGETSQLMGRVLHMIDIRRIWTKLRLCKTRCFHERAKSARVWASSLASVSLGESSSARSSSQGLN